MFDFLSWSEIGVIGLVAVLVLGPKELPNALRTLGKFTRQARKLAGDFQGQVNDLVREAELDDLRKSVQRVTNVNVSSEIDKLLDPSGDFAAELARTEQQMQQSLAAADAPVVQEQMPVVEPPPPEPSTTPMEQAPPREGAS